MSQDVRNKEGATYHYNLYCILSQREIINKIMFIVLVYIMNIYLL